MQLLEEYLKKRTRQMRTLSPISRLLIVFVQRFLPTPTVVHVYRPSEVEERRKDLPIVMMEEEIMGAINYNSNVIIWEKLDVVKQLRFPRSVAKDYPEGQQQHDDKDFGKFGIEGWKKKGLTSISNNKTFPSTAFGPNLKSFT
ncbi:hypothetical protein RYX36_023692 [Vicia faba]